MIVDHFSFKKDKKNSNKTMTMIKKLVHSIEKSNVNLYDKK